jgi:hypothetical protein
LPDEKQLAIVLSRDGDRSHGEYRDARDEAITRRRGIDTPS